jgi:hypothetical protein
VKGIRSSGTPDEVPTVGVGGVNTHPSDSSKSAEPDEEVEALLPC